MTREAIRCAFVIDHIESDKGGTEGQLVAMLGRLPAVDVAPRLVCLNETPWLRRARLDCPVAVLGYEGLLKPSLPGVIGRLRRLVREHDVDVVQTFFEDAIFVTWLALGYARRRPVLLSSRRDIGLGVGQPWYHRILERLRPRALASFDGVIANAEAAKRYTAAQDRVPAERIRVIHNGIDLGVEARPRPAVFDAADVDLWIVIAANFNPVKRHDVFVEALARIRRKAPDLRFRALLLGMGPREETVRALVRELGLAADIVFEGSVDDVGAYLDHADIGVLCSQREGLSNAILEYMKHGLPVVATDVGGNGELVDAANGALVAPGDSEALGDAIASLARDRDRLRRCGEASRARVERLCSWDATLAAYRAIYEDFLARRAAAR